VGKKTFLFSGYFLTTFCLVFLVNCEQKENFPPLDQKVAFPIDVAVHQESGLFYALNSDIDNRYNSGSILVLDREGNKLNAIPTPRMGRSLSLAGNDLIATFDRAGQEGEDVNKVILYDTSDPQNPALIKMWDLDCTPLNASLRENYRYFAVTCLGGKLLLGELTEDRSQSTLKVVRDFGPHTRRALYIDPVRQLLFAFVSDVGASGLRDEEFIDEGAYNEVIDPETNEKTYQKSGEPNDMPDRYESSAINIRSGRDARRRFQFLVYDIAAEAAKDFPLATTLDTKIMAQELRWIYFNLTQLNGAPDKESWLIDRTKKYYRTNFWEAKSDPLDPNIFYLSHRGIENAEGSPHSNQIVKITIHGNPRPASDDAIAPYTHSYFHFERVYGFKGDQKRGDGEPNYPGDFEVLFNQGQKFLVINNFRDLSNFRNLGGARFTITAAALDDTYWFEEVASTSAQDSYFQIAIDSQGRALTGSFYNSSLVLLDITPGLAITELKRIQ
jgi:hypothetical protein